MDDKKIISCPNCDKQIRVPVNKHIKFACPYCNENLEFNDIQAVKVKTEDDESDKENWGDPIIVFLSHIVVFPVFILLHKILPDPNWKFNSDRILLFVATLLIVEIILRKIRVISILAFSISFIYLMYGSFWGNYGFGSFFKDYKHMIYAMIRSPNPEEIIISTLKPFPHKGEIINAVDFENPEVRNFALEITRKYFTEEQDENPQYRTIIQCFAVFKEINGKWNYVSDPANSEYFAKASETLKHLSGDCDDHAIIMAACIKAIGGIPRLIYTTGHIYPELLIGSTSDMETVNYLIKKDLFTSEASGKRLEYHIDENGQVWLNLDYTEKYPGGEFMDEKILGTLTLD